MPNCCQSGRSRPSSLRVRSYTSSPARSPTAASTGSIGTTRPMRNVTSSKPKKVSATMTAPRPTRFSSGRAGSERSERKAPAALRVIAAGSGHPMPASLLGDPRVEVGSVGRAENEAVDALAVGRDLDLLEHDDERRDLLMLA